ncbi:DEAD/DEAH box helicase [Ancylostoma ceylanicum]|uniref:ATP-dependent RNA helicase n=1 Tax=Ancylostoma ceylanicum TaxID=53326 RepID=A0A0D6LG95_9BILA|nr:DEAD/DEAH box helicase [Ancylostoma ceylanicum]
MTIAAGMHGQKKKQRFKKMGKAKKERKVSSEKELESIIATCKDLPKANPSSFKLFTDLPLSSKTLQGLEDCDYEEPTDIQKESLPFSLSGSDVVGAAKTGSGKTLALIIPVLESLWRSGWSNQVGLGALIISPTRELALQTFTVINNVGKHHEFSCALLIGGTDVEYERKRIGSVNIIICTPGRLLQHMDENEHLSCDQLQILVLDEADRILDMGFSQQINAIVANLPKERQTLLFSATQTRNVKDLSRVCTKDPVFVSAHERCAQATPDSLMQWYMICEEQDKVNTIWSFIVNHKKSKTIIFVSSCKQARFLTGAFCHLRPGLPVMGLWGTMNQKKRVDVFQKFENKEAAVMIATDVASRGLDFSDVDWVIQADCPASVEDYIHRVGRTARMNQTGHAVLFLTPSQEQGMVAALRQANIPLEKQIVDPKALVDIRIKMQAVLSQFPELNQHAQKSVVAYLRSIYMMKNKRVFDVTSIDAAELASSFGLMSVPRVRFLSKKGLNANKSKNGENNSPAAEESSAQKENGSGDKGTNNMGSFEVDENDDLFVVKKKDVFSLLGNDSASNCEASPSTAKATTGPKVITKMNAAKKLLNKKVKLNVRKVFDEEGAVAKVEGVVETVEEAAGLDLASAVESMKQSSAEDRKRHKELIKQRKKEEKARLKKKRSRERGDDLDLGEGGSGIDSDADLSFLPDPDEVRRRYAEEDGEKEAPDESDPVPTPLRKRRKQREELKSAEQQALALLNPF